MRAPLTFLLAAGIIVGGGYAGLVWLASPSTIGQRVNSESHQARSTPNASGPANADRPVLESSSSLLVVTDENATGREAKNRDGKSLLPLRSEGLLESSPTNSGSSPTQQATENDRSKATSSSNGHIGAAKAHDAPVGGCMPIGITAGGSLVFPMECRELLEQHRGAHASLEPLPEAKPTAPLKQALTVEHEVQTPSSVRDNNKQTSGSARDRDVQTVGTARDHDLQTVGAAIDHNPVNSPSLGSDGPAGLNTMPPTKVKRATEDLRTIGENGTGREKGRESSRALNGQHGQKRFSELLKDPLAFNCVNCLLFGY